MWLIMLLPTGGRRGRLCFGGGCHGGRWEIPQLSEGVVAVGIPQDDKPVLRDDNAYLGECMEMNGGVEAGTEDVGGITIWAEAEERSQAESESKASDRSVRSTQANSTQALSPKQLGEIAEAEFVAKAVEMGFVVAKPWG